MVVLAEKEAVSQQATYLTELGKQQITLSAEQASGAYFIPAIKTVLLENQTFHAKNCSSHIICGEYAMIGIFRE